MAITNRSNGVKVLSTRHYAWLYDHISGMTTKDIAAKFNVTPRAVNAVISSDIAQAEIQMLREKVAENMASVGMQVQALRPQAIKVLQATLHDHSTTDKALDRKVKVALAVLDNPLTAKEVPEEDREKSIGVHVHVKGPTAGDILIQAGIKERGG